MGESDAPAKLIGLFKTRDAAIEAAKKKGAHLA
jgi:hypothetical protein